MNLTLPPLAGNLNLTNPSAATDSVVFGTDDNGDAIDAPLYGNHWLIVGNAGAGKTMLLDKLKAYALGMEHVTVFDANATDPYSTSINTSSMATVEEVYFNVANVLAEMYRRFDYLNINGLAELPPSKQWPLLVCFVDELTMYTSQGDQSNKFNAMLDFITYYGRDLGVCLVATTQMAVPELPLNKFTHKVLLRSTNAQRDLFVANSDIVSPVAIDVKEIPVSEHLGYAFNDNTKKVTLFRLLDIDHCRVS